METVGREEEGRGHWLSTGHGPALSANRDQTSRQRDSEGM